MLRLAALLVALLIGGARALLQLSMVARNGVYASGKSAELGKMPRVQKREKNKSFLPPGYETGDLARLQHIHGLLAGQCSKERLVECRYLRFWSGKSSDLDRIWAEVAGEQDGWVSYEQLPALLTQLDRVSASVRQQMERESQEWLERDLELDCLHAFFDSACSEGALAFAQFIRWDRIKSEMWYNEKSLSPESIARRWALTAGSLENTLDFNQFSALYKEICKSDYVA